MTTVQYSNRLLRNILEQGHETYSVVISIEPHLLAYSHEILIGKQGFNLRDFWALVDGVLYLSSPMLGGDYSTTRPQFLVITEGGRRKTLHILMEIKQSTISTVTGVVWWSRKQPESFTSVTFEEDTITRLM